jgi:crossover junction endodeoxyribonuclease RuvC
VIIIGIDPSLTGTSNIALEAGTGKLLQHNYQRLSSKRMGMIRLTWLRDQVKALLDEMRSYKDPDGIKVFLEGYSFGSKGQGLYNIAEWGGVLRLLLWEQGIPYTIVPPASLKKFVTDAGNADKLKVALAIQRIYGMEFNSDDEFDAYGLAQFGRAYLGYTLDLHKYQKEVIEKLKKGA